MPDGKYITFKTADWEEFTGAIGIRGFFKEQKHSIERFAVDDAVVIRRKDVFAASALHTYANSIAITARTIGELAPSTRDRLQGIADYFHEQAVLADEDPFTKLPD
jgi:hypothetical protein